MLDMYQEYIFEMCGWSMHSIVFFNFRVLKIDFVLWPLILTMHWLAMATQTGRPRDSRSAKAHKCMEKQQKRFIYLYFFFFFVCESHHPSFESNKSANCKFLWAVTRICTYAYLYILSLCGTLELVLDC